MKKRVVSLGLAAMMAMSMTACGGSGNASTSESAAEDAQGAEGADGEVFKISGIGPITGAAGAYGAAVKNGTELAINEINEAGGINGYQVAFNFQDDENDPEKAINAYNTLKDWNMQMLLGTVTSKPCIAVVAETAADNLFQLTPSGSAVESISGDNAFRVCYSDPDQGRASAQYIGEHKLATKIAIIYDSSSEYSDGIRETFVETAVKCLIVGALFMMLKKKADGDKKKEYGAAVVCAFIYGCINVIMEFTMSTIAMMMVGSGFAAAAVAAFTSLPATVINAVFMVIAIAVLYQPVKKIYVRMA